MNVIIDLLVGHDEVKRTSYAREPVMSARRWAPPTAASRHWHWSDVLESIQTGLSCTAKHSYTHNPPSIQININIQKQFARDTTIKCITFVCCECILCSHFHRCMHDMQCMMLCMFSAALFKQKLHESASVIHQVKY